MLENLHPRSDVKGFARKQGRTAIWRTVKPGELDEYLQAGWEIRRRNKNTIAIKRAKSRQEELESRVWILLYRMGFHSLSGAGGARLNVKDQLSEEMGVVAIDEEVGLAAICDSREVSSGEAAFATAFRNLSSLRRPFAAAVRKLDFGAGHSPHISTMVFLWDSAVVEKYGALARENNILLLDLQDLEYFEALTKHLGQAARYQFLAEVFKGKRIKGLEVKVPALRTAVGGSVSYTFSIRPEYLLKISYVAHRAKGKAFDVDAYQRMISKSRLRSIGEFISAGGIFPTNIVINVEKSRHVQFDQSVQLGSDEGGRMGWLTLRPGYGTAWIIDGQHRLFAYAGHERASTSYLNVLAFEGLSPARQTELFVEINSEQRRVKRSLLVELDATLKWEDEDEDKRIHAIISKVGMALDERLESPLRGRVLLADGRRTATRCISLTAVASALRRRGFFIISRKHGATQYGPFWRKDPSDSLRRAVRVLSAWFGAVAELARDWWDLGSDEGGGLAMNDGVTVCINVLRGVMDHLNVRGELLLLDDEELVERLSGYAEALGRHFARMSPEERQGFRRLRGVQGQTTGMMTAYQSLSNAFPGFEAPGLEEWVERRRLNTNERARTIIDRMERAIQARVLEELKAEFDRDENDWWFTGVPKAVRQKVDFRINEMDGGKREENFDLLHYEAIMHANWELFGAIFAYGEKANPGKQKGTAWLRDVGSLRNKVMHPSRNDYASVAELDRLESYESWLRERLAEEPE